MAAIRLDVYILVGEVVVGAQIGIAVVEAVGDVGEILSESRHSVVSNLGVVVEVGVAVVGIEGRIAQNLEVNPEGEAVACHYDVVGEESSASGQLAHITISVAQQFSRHQVLFRLTRTTRHDVNLSFFVSEGEGGIDVSTDTDDQHEDVGERKWDLHDDQTHKRPDFSHVGS